MILHYDGVKDRPKTFKAMTSLERSECDKLCPIFTEVWSEYTRQSEKNPSKGGRKPYLKTAEDKLFFILFYLKTYPLQEILGYLFGMSQSQANFYIDEFSQVLKKALQKTEHLPVRLPADLLARLAEEEAQDLVIDGTERRKERPKDPVYQKRFYSGKKSPHV